jgi:hypothetical protein
LTPKNYVIQEDGTHVQDEAVQCNERELMTDRELLTERVHMKSQRLDDILNSKRVKRAFINNRRMSALGAYQDRKRLSVSGQKISKKTRGTTID